MMRRLRGALRRRGIEVARFNPRNSVEARRAALMKSFAIERVLDVGANSGQYGTMLRENGFRGAIVSFEPLTGAYGDLERASSADSGWYCYNVALGARNGGHVMNVSANSWSSSMLPICDRSVVNDPTSAYVGTQPVTVVTLDDVWDSLPLSHSRTLLKLDVQGYEGEVLAGASNALASLIGVETELSLVPLYEGQATYSEILASLEQRGFQLVSIEPGFCDLQSGRLLQCDAILVRPEAGNA